MNVRRPQAQTRELGVLLVEDSPNDAELISAQLRDGGLRCHLTRVTSAERFDQALGAGRYDVILADYRVPGFEGPALLEAARRRAPATPFVFISLAIGDERAIELLKRGATDWVLKDRLDRLVPAVERAVREADEREALRRAEEGRALWTQRLEVLAHASQVLASSLDYESTLQNVLALVLPALGDFGFFDVRAPDGSVRRLTGPQGDAKVRALLQLSHWERSDPALELSSLVSGLPALHPVIDEAWRLTAALSPEHLALMRELQLSSMLCVPLLYRGSSLGGLTLFHAGGGRRHGQQDLTLALELAARAAAAVENARLFAAQVRARHAVEGMAEQLRRREERSRVLVESLVEGVVVLDERGGVVQANRAAEQLLGRAPVVGTRPVPDWDLRREDGSPFSLDARSAAGEAVWALRPDGERIWLHLSVESLPPAPGSAAGVVMSFFDLTARKQAQVEAERRVEFEQQLVGIVSHDLRGPINAIQLSAQVLLKEELPPLAHRTAARVLSSAQRASRLIHDLLDFTQARLGSGIPIRRQQVDLHQVARGVVEEVETAHPTRTLRFYASGVAEGAWDPDRIAQVVGNLLVNAVVYSPEGTEVTVRSEGRAGEVRLHVHNEGEPIPESVRARLFEPFKSRGARRTGQDASVGLGLFIVDQLVRAHGGRVQVRSQPREGTTFTVVLPK